uniref:Uncharacterized protein MANES_17G111900 n=1 Tax=Rhizophora mucronata TaxID=61149 RepID=A0A2P2JGT9_RHIMU
MLVVIKDAVFVDQFLLKSSRRGLNLED